MIAPLKNVLPRPLEDSKDAHLQSAPYDPAKFEKGDLLKMVDAVMDKKSEVMVIPAPTPHPRTIGWIGTTALAMGGSNQSLFLIGILLLSQGSAAVPLLIVGLVLSWSAAFGWTELAVMFPNRVGGIAATC